MTDSRKPSGVTDSYYSAEGLVWWELFTGLVDSFPVASFDFAF